MKSNSLKITFQRWIPWFPQRWRTPRNAICNVNCRIKWIIKSLNANGCSGPRGWSIPGPDSFAKRKMLYRTRHWALLFWIASPQELKRPCAPLASKRCAEVVKHQGALCFWRRGLFQTSCFRAGLRQEDPLNLNILLSGGKETNKDSLSNGEWSGNSSMWKSASLGRRIVVWVWFLTGHRV